MQELGVLWENPLWYLYGLQQNCWGRITMCHSEHGHSHHPLPLPWPPRGLPSSPHYKEPQFKENQLIPRFGVYYAEGWVRGEEDGRQDQHGVLWVVL